MKKFRMLIVLLVMLVSILVLPCAANAQESFLPGPKTASTTITPRADVIVYKFRVYNGILQYRRWNETWGYWVDDDWISIGEWPGD